MKRYLLPTLIGTLAVIAAGVGLGLLSARPDLLRAARARVTGVDPEARCETHGVPDRFCTICHPELKVTLPLCEEHGGLPEAICAKCHPEAAKTYDLTVCAAHGMPEAFCPDCAAAQVSAAKLADCVDDGWCTRHGRPEADCPECAGGKGQPLECRSLVPILHLASDQTIEEIGLETGATRLQEHYDEVVGNAEIEYPIHDMAEVQPRVGGLIHEVLTDEGRVEPKGALLAVIDSAEVGTAKANFLAILPAVELARVNYDRYQSLSKGGSIPRRMELEALAAKNKADADLLDARQRLLNLGFTPEQLDELAETKDTSRLLKVVAPIEGRVVARHAVAGEAVLATHPLFVMVNTRRMWAWIDVEESQVDRVEAGQAASFTISGTTEPVFEGQVDLIDSEVNPATRTVRVRAVMQNPTGRLRAKQFGTARIRVSEEHTRVVVPREAVQSAGGASVVFIPQGDAAYRPQRVVVEPMEQHDLMEVAWGLEPGVAVVTTGSFLLRTELQKDEIGEGCCR